jgi:hypothetical protein
MADSKQTELGTYLSAILLGGLLLNALLGGWANPVAALVMVPIIVKEGIEGLRGKTCCDDECYCSTFFRFIFSLTSAPPSC